MATDVIIPVLGMSQDSGRLVQWLKQPGETVKAGEILFEVETDKAVVEIEAPVAGTLGPWLVEEGDVVPVTQVVVRLYEPGEQPAPAEAAAPGAPTDDATSAASAPARRPEVAATPLAARVAAAHNVDLAQIKQDGGKVHKADVLAFLADAEPEPAGRPLASPKARRLAAERDVALETIQGSGPNGAVLAGDVMAWQPPAAASKSSSAPAASTPPEPEASALPMSTTWRIMAERTTQAWTAAPHFFLQRRALAGQFLAWQRSVQARMDVKVTASDLLVMVCARALALHRQINTTWREGRPVALPDINIGLAVALDDGLVVPVIGNADRLSLRAIAQTRADLVARARDGRLRMEDLAGGTFTISNLGMFGVERFLAILNPPQAAILAVGAIHDQVLAIDGQPSIQPVLELSVSFDHRVVDGARGARFLQTLVALIEDPLQLLE